MKAPPAEVPALTDSAGDSAEQALTIKDLLAKHRTVESCNDCHVRLDPWGIPFERYNAIGKYQPFVPKEGTRVRGFDQKTDNDLAGYAKYVESVNTQEVQADARVPHGPHVDGMPQLKAHLLNARKDDIAENVIRRLLTYAIGRELNYRDRFDVDNNSLARSRENGFLLQDMIVSICQSSTFRMAQPTTFVSNRSSYIKVMKHKSWHLDRRELLKGGGVALALPLLNGMGNAMGCPIQSSRRGRAPQADVSELLRLRCLHARRPVGCPRPEQKMPRKKNTTSGAGGRAKMPAT